MESDERLIYATWKERDDLNIKNEELSILVYSCYKNRDMWRYFSYFFRKYYPDCEFKIVLVTDFFEREDEYVFDKVVIVDESWSNMIKKAIYECGSPYIMLFMDDYFLNASVSNSDIEQILTDMKTYGAVNIRMTKVPFSRYMTFGENMDYKHVKPGTAYSLCTQPGIWSSQFFVESVDDGISAWYFERNCSMEYCADSLLILECTKYRLPYIEAVRKGRWMNEGIRLLKKHDLVLDYSNRKKMSIIDNVIKNAKGIILLIAPDFIQNIQNMFNQSKDQK